MVVGKKLAILQMCDFIAFMGAQLQLTHSKSDADLLSIVILHSPSPSLSFFSLFGPFDLGFIPAGINHSSS